MNDKGPVCEEEREEKYNLTILIIDNLNNKNTKLWEDLHI